MSCHDIRNMISPYLDGMLDEKSRSVLEEHVASCTSCGKVLSDMKKTLSCIHSIEDVEPPPWLAQNVMTRIKAEGEREASVWRKLFHPFHIKLPLEAVGVVFIAMIVFYVLQSMEPAFREKTAGTKGEAPVETLEPSSGDTILDPSQNISPPAALSERRISEPEKESEVEEALPDVEFPPHEAVPREREGVRSLKKKAIQGEAVEEERPGYETKDEMGTVGEEIVPDTGRKEIAQYEASETPGGKEALRSDDGLIPKRSMVTKRIDTRHIDVYVSDVEHAVSEIRELISQLGGEVVREERHDEENVITAMIDETHIPLIMERLKKIGEMKPTGHIPEFPGSGRESLRIVVKKKET